MATTQGMSGVDLLAVTAELREHLPLWINKIYQYDNKTLSIRLNGEEHAKYHLLIESGRRVHLATVLPNPPKNPPSFAMLLRKYLEGGKVLEIRQQGLQRVVTFVIGKRDTTLHLVFELFDEGNVILCDDQLTIIKPLWHHRFKDREVIPGVTYTYSGSSEPAPDQQTLNTLLSTSDRDVVRTLAVGCMLGGQYAEEVCTSAGISKETPATEADPVAIGAALEGLFARVSRDRDPVVTAGGAWPIVLTGMTPISHHPTFSQALEAIYPLVTKHDGPQKKAPIPREERIRLQQEAALKSFDKKIVLNRAIVDQIYENYTLVADVIRTLDVASRTLSWQEIGAMLKESDNQVARQIAGVHPAEAAADLLLGERKVLVHVHESVEANVERYYAQVKKFKKKRDGAVTAMKRPLVKKAQGKVHLTPLKKRWYHRFRWFFTSDNCLVLGGRDAGQNEELVKRYMEGGDTFVHADVHGASVVMVKGKTERMNEVAQFAASYSGAWRSGHFSADVYAVRPDQVSKTPEAGEFVSRGAFIVRGERTYFKSVPLGVAIGYQTEPNVAVIGGPVNAVEARTKQRVLLKPGPYEPNDIAKKVLRQLRETIPEEDWRGLKTVLNTEQVAGYVPPGGSEIIGV